MNAKLLGQLFLSFAKVGVMTFGGGMAMLPILQREVVEDKGWATDEELVDYFAIGQCTPGIIAVNMSSLIGYRIAGVPGVLSAVLGVVLPPFLTIVAIAYFLFNVFDLAAVQHAFMGIRAGVCAMILVSVIKMARKSLRSAFAWTVALAGFLTLLLADVNIILLIVAGALSGLALAGVSALRARRLAQGGQQA